MDATNNPPLHITKVLPQATFNRLFMAVYAVALLALFYHHTQTLITTNSSSSPSLFFINSFLLLANLILAFNWVCTQSYHLRPIHRLESPENLYKITKEHDFPAVDIFICTADPLKEPPMGTVNTALSAMAYDYPPEKLSIYVSDDGGSKVSLFAFAEAAKFARHWLPFCRENKIMDRCPQAYFESYLTATRSTPHSQQVLHLKKMYGSMKMRVENAIEGGKIIEEEDVDDEIRDAFAKWTPNFSRQNHPPVIQILLASFGDRDVSGEFTPNLIYLSREKNNTHNHHFKAGALNTLLRVSATMTNAPIVLALDCDTYSNDPQTIKRALCYHLDPVTRPNLAYVQFPQIFHGLNKADIYNGEHKHLFQINSRGCDGLRGPNYVGANCFFNRRAFFGSPLLFIKPEIPELSPYYMAQRPIRSPEILRLAHEVAVSNYEEQTYWGSKLGFRYGSLVEDYYTGYQLQCEGWKSIFCHPKRPAFLGDKPIILIDQLGQCKRWSIGLLEVLFSKYSTITYGVQQMGLFMGLAYTHYGIWPIMSIPYTFYAFIPQLALLNGVSIFPKVMDPWFVLYMFLFMGAYAKDLLNYKLEKGSIERWWNSQRMWMIYGLSSFLFGCIEYTLSSLGIAVRGFDLTSKVQDIELSERYDQGIFEFGVTSPMLVPLSMAAIINLISLVVGLLEMFTKGFTHMNGLVLQLLISGFVVINCFPIYEAMVFRNDKGKMPFKMTLVSALMVSILWLAGHLLL